MDFDVEVPKSENTPKVKEENDADVIDLDIYKTVEEISEEWSRKVIKYFKYFFTEDMERNLSAVMKWYIQNLEDEAVDQIDDKIMRIAMEKHMLFFKLYFREMDCRFNDNYLEHMEDILAIYCDAKVKTLPKKRSRNVPSFKDELFNICQRLVSLLRVYLLGQERCVLHVLLKMRMYKETEEAQDFFNLMFSYFVKAYTSSKSDLTFCRIYILCQRWKSVKPKSEWNKMDEQLYATYGRTPDSLESNDTLRKILLPNHVSVLDILARGAADSQNLIKNYFEFIRSTDVNDLDQMHNADLCGDDEENIPDFAMEEDKDFLKIYHEHIEAMANAVNVTNVGETIDLSDDEDNIVKDDPDSDVEFLPTTQECIEILSDSDDETVFKPVEPDYLKKSTMLTGLNESEVSRERATPSQNGVLNTRESNHTQVNIQNNQSNTTDLDIGTLCPNENVSSPSCNNVMKKGVTIATQTDSELDRVQEGQSSSIGSLGNLSGDKPDQSRYVNNLNQEKMNIETSQSKIDCVPDNSRTNSPGQLIVETPITISASPQPSPNSTQHPSSTSHIVNKCSGDSYVSATSPDISSTLFDEDDSYHESSSSMNSSNNINGTLYDSTNNENNVTQSNIDIGESIGTPERECYSPMDKTYSHENESDHSNKETQDSAASNGILTPPTADTSSVQNGNDMPSEFQNNKSLKVSDRIDNSQTNKKLIDIKRIINVEDNVKHKRKHGNDSLAKCTKLRNSGEVYDNDGNFTVDKVLSSEIIGSNNVITNKYFPNQSIIESEFEDVDTHLPLKKRKLSIANCKDEEEDDDDLLEPTLVDEIIKRARNENTYKEDISSPAGRMISIAEVEEKLRQQRQFRTPAEKKEMPTTQPLHPENMTPKTENLQPNVENLPPTSENIPSYNNMYEVPKIVTEQYNNHTYNNPTINYHMNKLPSCFFPCASLPYFPPIILPMSGTFDMNMVNKKPPAANRQPTETSSRTKRRKKSIDLPG